MQFPDSSPEVSSPFAVWQKIASWATTHYRGRVFTKDDPIPARQGLLYLVCKGAVRLNGMALNADSSKEATIQNRQETDRQDRFKSSLSVDIGELQETPNEIEEAFLGFILPGKPFEIVTESCFSLQAYAHIDNTEVIWLYWKDLENWPDFKQEVYAAIRYQNQRKLLWISALGQRKAIDRLLSFIILLMKEYGQQCDEGYYLPYILTHAQIGSTIGSTRVTVTRLMGKLRRQGLITVKEDNIICLPASTGELIP